MQVCKTAARRASIGLREPEGDPVEGTITWQSSGLRRSEVDSPMLISTDRGVKRVLWTTVSQTVFALAVNGA